MKPIARLYYFIFKTRLSFVMGTLILAVSLVLANASPFFVKLLTESVQDQKIDTAFVLVGVFGIFLVVSNILENIAFLIADRNMAVTSTTITQAVLTHIHNLDFAYHTNKSSGKLISLMKRGDDAYFSYYDILNRSFLSIGISFLVMFGAFTQLRWTYIVFVLVLIGISFLISIFLVKLNVAKRDIFNSADDEVSSARVDNLVNFDTVKYFANERYEQARFAGLLRTWYETLLNYFFTFRYFDFILGNIINVALVGIMFMALLDLQRGFLTLADFLLVTTFSMTLFPKMMNLLFSLRELAKKHSDLKAYLGLLDEKIVVKDPSHPQSVTEARGDVMFDHVTFGYDKDASPILRDFHLHIHAGEAIALVGYSGAGKTTIAKLLMRMYDPQQGSVLLDGIDIKNVAKEDLRTKVGIVPQDPLLFNNTIRYNIAYAKSTATEEEILAAAQSARVSDFVKKLPEGYDTVVGERGIKLSGGQRQRLAIARVLLEQPEILIFDEATSALDSASEQIIQAAFWSIVREKEHPRTAIIIAHRLSTIMRADRIVVMDKGSIVETGTHQELMSRKEGIYYQLWSLQRDGFIGDGET
ncbi:ABC transporter ATP-binding protein [Candidatus Woesebacteria bacterium]|nr:ABC transporter ATP-binding protein [Candidatus Woesebacteria bacterium]